MVAMGLTFLQTLVMTRVLGVEVFGLFSFAIAISAILVLVLSMGLDQVIMRDVARAGPGAVAATTRWRDSWSLVRGVVVPLVLGVAVVGVGLSLGTDWFAPYRVTLAAAFAMLPFVLARRYTEQIALGAKAIMRSMIGTQIGFPALMIAGGLVVWALPATPSAMSAAMIYMAAVLGSVTLASLIIRPIIAGPIRAGAELEPVADTPGKRALVASGGNFAIIALGLVVSQQLSVLMTGLLSDPESVALVRVAGRVAELAGLISVIALLQFKPLLAEAHAKGETEVLARHVATLTLVFVATGLPIFVVIWAVAEEIMWVFGPDFVAGGWALRIFAIGVLATMLSGPSTTLLSMAGAEADASRIHLMALALQFGLALILIPLYGAIGAAVSSTVSLVTLAAMGARRCVRDLSIDPTVFGIRRNLRPKA